MDPHDVRLASELEIDPDVMRAMGRAVVDRIVDHLSTIESQPVAGDVRAEALCRAMREPAPEQGTSLDSLLGPLFEEWIPRSFTTPSPGYFAYIPGGGLFPGALADFIAAGVNRFTGVWEAAPALVQLESNALDWLRDWMGFPPTTRGLFTSGGSTATLNAILCARERSLGSDIRSGVMYHSVEAHHSVRKSARLAGIMPDRIRTVPVDREFRLDLSSLEREIAADRARDLRPFLIVSSAGTVNTGAVDPLDRITALAAREDLWHHVDGAYGACFHLCPELRPLLPGLSGVDSLTLDPHKGLFLPYGTGALLVRDGSMLRRVHAATATYLPDSPDLDEFYDPSQHGPDLSRAFPGLRVWLSVKVFGAARFRAALAEKRELALAAAARLAEADGFVVLGPPQLSLFAFYVTWPGASREQEDAATNEVLERVRARGKAMLTGCRAGGRFLGRLCVLSFRSHAEHVETAVTQLIEERAALVAAQSDAVHE